MGKSCEFSKNGLENLLDKYRALFRIPENLNFYSKKDYRKAEKKYLKYCINTGLCGVSLHNQNYSKNH